MRTRIAAVLLCLLLALALAGCVHADRGVSLNADGTGSYTFAIGLSPQMVDLGGSALTDSMNAFGERVKQQGGTYSHSQDGGYSTWKYVRPFTSIDQLNTFLNQAPRNQASGDSTNENLHVTEQQGYFSTTYHVTGHMSLAFPQANQAARDLLKDARESFAVTMPGWVSAQRGGNLSGNTVTYTIHLDQSATIDVTGGGLNMSHLALVAGGVLLALLLVIMGVLLLRRDRRRPSAPAFSTSPYHMPTQPGMSGVPAGETPTFPATPASPSDGPPNPPYDPLPMTTPTPE